MHEVVVILCVVRFEGVINLHSFPCMPFVWTVARRVLTCLNMSRWPKELLNELRRPRATVVSGNSKQMYVRMCVRMVFRRGPPTIDNGGSDSDDVKQVPDVDGGGCEETG